MPFVLQAQVRRLGAVVFAGWLIVTLLLLPVPGSLGCDNTTNVQTQPQLFLPFYVYPHVWRREGEDCDYARVGRAMATLGDQLDVVINPHNGLHALGPPNSDWVTGLNFLKMTAGTNFHKLFGYVRFNWGHRNLEAAKSEISGYAKHWKKWVGHILLDEVGVTDEHAKYIKQIVRHTRRAFGRDATVVLNPGRSVPAHLTQEFLRLERIASIISFESYYLQWESFKIPKYQCIYNERQDYNGVAAPFTAIALRVTLFDDAMSFFQRATQLCCFQRVYATDHSNYNDLPTYFEQLVQVISQQSSSNLKEKPAASGLGLGLGLGYDDLRQPEPALAHDLDKAPSPPYLGDS